MLKRYRKVWLALSLLLVVGLVAVACGSEATPTPVPATATTAPDADPTATSAADAEPTATTAAAAEPTSTTAPAVEPTPAPEVSVLPPGAASLVEGMPVCEGTEDAISGGTMRAFAFDISNFDVASGDWYAAASVQGFTHLRLTQWNNCNPHEVGDYTAYPYLAESWEVSGDGLTVTFHLRQGVNWQNKPPVNGREVVADDVVYSYRRYIEPDSPNVSLLGPVASVEALDKYTVQFTLSDLSPGFLPATGYPAFPIYAPEVLEEFGSFEVQESNIGAGPWQFVEYEPDVRIVLERNPGYFRGPEGITGETLPYLDRIEFFIVYEDAPRLAMYRGGEVDVGPSYCCGFGYWTGGIEINKTINETNPELAEDSRFFVDTPYSIYYLQPKVDRPPFNNEKLRQAVSMVIDRSCEAWCRTFGADDNRELSAAHPWYVPLEDLGEGAKYYPVDESGNPARDVEGAKVLANEARAEMGLEPDETIATTVYTYNLMDTSMMELFKVWVAEIGIEVDLVILDDVEFLGSIQSFPFEYDGISYGYRDPPPWDVDGRFSPVYLPGASFNNGGVDDPEITELVLAQRSETDPVAREAIIRELQKVLAVKQYEWIVPSYQSQDIYPPWLKNVGSQKSIAGQGGTFLQTWLTADATEQAIRLRYR